jgi:hypothetical protein
MKHEEGNFVRGHAAWSPVTARGMSSTADIDPRRTGQIDTRKLPGAKAVIISAAIAAIAAIAATLAVIKATSALHSPTVRPSHVTPREAASWHPQDGKLLWLADPAGEHAKDGLQRAAAAMAESQPVSASWHAQDGKLLWLADPAGEHATDGLQRASSMADSQAVSLTIDLR